MSVSQLEGGVLLSDLLVQGSAATHCVNKMRSHMVPNLRRHRSDIRVSKYLITVNHFTV